MVCLIYFHVYNIGFLIIQLIKLSRHENIFAVVLYSTRLTQLLGWTHHQVKNFKNQIFRFLMIKLGCKVVPINNFQRQGCSSKWFEGNHEKTFEIDAYLPILQRFQLMLWAQCSKRCISKTAALIYVCDIPLESLLSGLIGGKFISRRGAISTRRARPTASVVLFVNLLSIFHT